MQGDDPAMGVSLDGDPVGVCCGHLLLRYCSGDCAGWGASWTGKSRGVSVGRTVSANSPPLPRTVRTVSHRGRRTPRSASREYLPGACVPATTAVARKLTDSSAPPLA